MQRCVVFVVPLACLLTAAQNCDDHAHGILELLQLGLDIRPYSAAARRLTVEPLKYLHIPKCGTSFLNAIVHTPGLCPGVDWTYQVDSDHLNVEFEHAFWKECPKVCNTSQFECNPVGVTHEGIGDSYDGYKGHLITMLRQPEQRIMSSYYDTSWDHGASHYSNVSAYAERVQGLMTCQIVGAQSVDPLPQCGDLSEADAFNASQRLREGFAFVGLLEEWDLSICLFRTMFGGQCWFSDFENTRPTSEELSPYDVAELDGFVDKLDRIVYNEGKRIFQDLLVSFNVTEESCRSCWAFRNQTARAAQRMAQGGTATAGIWTWLLAVLAVLCTLS